MNICTSSTHNWSVENLPQKPNESTFRFGFTEGRNILIGCMGKSKILDNIGILNAKGKSKEALELLRQWSKEGEYFSSKIKEVTGHIDGLNAEVNKWQSKV